MQSTTRHAPVTSEFTELVCADPGWLHAEFDAIMTADFGALPPRPPMPRPGSAGPRRPGQMPRTAARCDGVLVGVVPAAGDLRRQRSPPPPDAPLDSASARYQHEVTPKQVIPAQPHPDCARLAGSACSENRPRKPWQDPGPRVSRRTPPDGTADGAAARVICRRWSAQRDHRAALLLERSSTNRLRRSDRPTIRHL
jgi:hypothetical protein